MTLLRYIAVGGFGLALAAGPALAQKAGGTLQVYHNDNPPSASIHEEATISTVMPFAAVFNNLVMFDPETRQNRIEAIVPELATGWSWNEDGTQLRFELRDGVKWHDGRPFTSADVKCTWDLIQGKSEDRLRKNPRKPWYHNLKEVTVDGDRAVVFHLERPQPAFLVLLASLLSPVYPCHIPAAQMRTNPIGTGPFKFVEFQQNSHIRLTRNPDYWKEGRPYLDGIEYTIVRSRSTRVLGFIAGKFDLTLTADVTIPLVRDVAQQAPHAVCEVLPTNTQTVLMMNRDQPPFDDARVRRVLQLAIDRKAFTDILTEGQAKIGGTMLPPPEGLWGMPEEVLQGVVGYDPDVAKSRAEARAIMKELGYGPDKPLPLKLVTREYASYRDAAVLLLDHLKEVHIAAELETLDSTVWYNRLVRKDYGVALSITGLGVDDPDVNFYENYACDSARNYTRYCNPEIEKLFDEQSRMADQEKRRELVWQIDKKLQEDGARPVIYHGRAGTCWQPYVKGVKPAVNTIYNHWRFESVWLDK